MIFSFTTGHFFTIFFDFYWISWWKCGQRWIKISPIDFSGNFTLKSYIMLYIFAMCEEMIFVVNISTLQHSFISFWSTLSLKNYLCSLFSPMNKFHHVLVGDNECRKQWTLFYSTEARDYSIWTFFGVVNRFLVVYKRYIESNGFILYIHYRIELKMVIILPKISCR